MRRNSQSSCSFSLSCFAFGRGTALPELSPRKGERHRRSAARRHTPLKSRWWHVYDKTPNGCPPRWFTVCVGGSITGPAALGNAYSARHDASTGGRDFSHSDHMHPSPHRMSCVRVSADSSRVSERLSGVKTESVYACIHPFCASYASVVANGSHA